MLEHVEVANVFPAHPSPQHPAPEALDKHAPTVLGFVLGATHSQGGLPPHVPDGVWSITCQDWCGLGTKTANAALDLLCACFRNQAASLPQTHKHQISMREKNKNKNTMSCLT